ncbi:MAG: hypothetical protein RJA52_593, partial [Bacteroidota bacterium]
MEKQTIKFSTAYRRLASVYVFHEYYKNKICKDLAIRPDGETQVKMNQYGILFRPEVNGFTLARDTNKSLEAFIFKGILELRFVFKITNPFFLNFTDITFKTDQFFSFTNRENAMLHQGAYVGNGDILNQEADGLQGQILLKFNFQGQSNEDKEDYMIFFQARKSLWKYKLNGSGEMMNGLKDYYIKSANRYPEEYKFFVTEAIGQGRGMGFEAISENALPFEEKPNFLFELRKDKTEGIHVPYKRILPNANPRNLLFDNNRNQFLTEIFVKL